jgi:hypothetical protein
MVVDGVLTTVEEARKSVEARVEIEPRFKDDDENVSWAFEVEVESEMKEFAEVNP